MLCTFYATECKVCTVHKYFMNYVFVVDVVRVLLA